MPSPISPGIPQSMSASVTYPRYVDIRGGGGGNYALRDPAYTEVERLDPESSAVFAFADDLVNRVKAYRTNYDQQWDSYYNIMEGRQWVNQSLTGVPRTHPWRARLNVNLTYAIMDTQASIIFDTDPKLATLARDPAQYNYTAQIDAGLDQIWYDQKLEKKARAASFNALTYGNGYLKFWWNRAADEGRGAIECGVVPTQCLYVDATTVSFDPGFWGCVVEEEVINLAQAKNRFPKKEHILRPDGDAQTFSEKISTTGYQGDWANQPLQIYSAASTGGSSQTVSLGITDYSAPPYRAIATRGDSRLTLHHVWLSPEWCQGTAGAYETKIEQMQVGMGPYGPLYMAHEVKQFRYPFGRLITIGGGVVCQDGPNPYRCLPYVLFQDIERSGQFFAKGEPDLLFDLQMDVNHGRSMLADSRSIIGNPVWVKETDAGISNNLITNQPGAILNVAPGASNKIRRETPPEMPNWISNTIQMSEQSMVTISGVGQMGGGVRGARSGTAAEAQHNAQTQRTRYKAKNTDQSLQDMGRIMVSLMQQFYTTPRMVRVMGNLGTWAFQPFDAWHCRGQLDFRIESASAASSTKVAREQMALQLYDRQIADKRFVLDQVEMPGKEDLARRTGIMMAPQPPVYPGWPGLPNPYRRDYSGYSLQARTMPQGPPMGPPSGPPAGPQGKAGPPGSPAPRPGPAGMSPKMGLPGSQ